MYLLFTVAHTGAGGDQAPWRKFVSGRSWDWEILPERKFVPIKLNKTITESHYLWGDGVEGAFDEFSKCTLIIR